MRGRIVPITHKDVRLAYAKAELPKHACSEITLRAGLPPGSPGGVKPRWRRIPTSPCTRSLLRRERHRQLESESDKAGRTLHAADARLRATLSSVLS
ncbi:hypothetical protein VUR80DRAFT_4956 [Thermomyces stellatus]